jgi:hypothetical protein
MGTLDTETALAEALAKPKEVEVDGQRVTNHSLSDLTEADRYLASKKAMAGRHLPIRITKMAAGGAII